MEFSIIINTHNQPKFIKRCILSCKNQNFDKKKYEIIIVDTSDNKNLNPYKNLRNIKIMYLKKISKLPCVNQFQAIKKAFENSNGKIICLIDGDDFFSNDKLTYIYRNFKNKKFINQDIPKIYYEDKKQKISQKKNFLKKKILFKKIINNWPDVFGTSCLSIDALNLKMFLKKYDNFKYPYLAIDTLLVNYAKYIKKFYEKGNDLTYKSLHNQNLDTSFSNKFTMKYWKRRIQQHQFNRSKFKNYINLDLIITKIINKLFDR